MARIATIVSNGCNPDPRVLREARWLVEEGHVVTIHAFDRFHELPLEEDIDRIKITRHRVGKTPYGGTLSTVMGLRRFRNSVRKSLGEIDLLHCHDADTISLAKSTTARTLFDMHDLHHTWALMPNSNSVLRRIIAKRMESNMLTHAKHVDAIITSSSGFVDWLAERNLPSVSIENRPESQDQAPLPELSTIGYFGRIREVQSFSLLIDALLNIPQENRPRVLIAGDGTCSSKVESLFATNSEIMSDFLGPFSHSDLPEMMPKISMMFAMYSPDRGNIKDGALPAKMFEAAAFGRPSIVNQNTLMGRICEDENLGVSVQWGDSESLATAITQLLNQTVELKNDESTERKRFLDVIENLLEK